MGQDYQNIINLTKIIIAKNIQRYKQIKTRFNYVKKHNIQNEKLIEELLDGLLDIINTYNDNKIISLYIKICLYYYNINPQYADEYYHYYLETLDEDKKKIKML